MPERPIHIVKLGGSLLDLADLAARVAPFLSADGGRHPLLLVGGGRAADVVRAFDATHGIGPTAAHWLAVRAMQLNAHLVASLLSDCRLVSDRADCDRAWSDGVHPVVDPFRWLEREQARGLCIPHRWTFTSDSIAAHVAVGMAAPCLTLLKSAIPPVTWTLEQASAAGLVDAEFPRVARTLACVQLMNLRCDPPRSIRLC